MTDRLRVVLLGYGFAGAWIHDPLISSVEELEVVAVVTTSEERRDLALSRHPKARVFSAADEALESSKADIAVVATPNRHHVELTNRSFEAGLAVVVDKPLANNAPEARTLLDQAARGGKTLAVFQNRRWDGDYLTLRRLVEENRIGPVHRLISRFDRWVPRALANWRDDPPEIGGGLLLDLGSHLVDQAIQVLGPVASVYCELDTLSRNRRSDDSVFVALQHDSGSISHLYASALEGQPSLRFHLTGLNGSYVKHGKEIQEERLLQGDKVVPGETGMEPAHSWGSLFRGADAVTVPTIPGDWSAFYRQLVAHLVEGEPNPVEGDEAWEVLRILDAARLSAMEGRVVTT